jgi:hypothetical protein
VGAVIRFNIAEAEPYLAQAPANDRVAWLARIGQIVLAGAYAVSIAYYLKLLALFSLRPINLDTDFGANLLVTAILAVLVALSYSSGGLRRVERVAEASVSAKLGLIAALLVALALAWATQAAPDVPLEPHSITPESALLLLGLLITVQGFETSRYMGDSFDAATRIRTMRWAQWIASAIYILFIMLLTPRLGQAAATDGVAGVLDVMRWIAPALGVVVLAAAVASQLSAAVADAIGSSGTGMAISGNRLSMPVSFLIAAGLALLVTWLTDATAVIAVASRAFALFYAIQCLLAFQVSRKRGVGGPWRQGAMLAIGAACLLAAVAGAPAEG